MQSIGGKTKLINIAIEHRRSVHSVGLYDGYLKNKICLSFNSLTRLVILDQAENFKFSSQIFHKMGLIQIKECLFPSTS